MFKKLLLLCSTSIALLAGCSSSKTALYKRITKDFYQQCCVEKGYLDDSSFCGYYEPRLITEDSILPEIEYTYQKNGFHIISFVINGFHLYNSYIAIDNNDDLSTFSYSYNPTTYSELLIPQVWKDGKICSLAEAYKRGIINRNYLLDYVSGKEGCSVYEFKKQKMLYNPPYYPKEYINKLPHLKNYENETKSLLIPKFQSIKDKFYQKEIVDKNYKDDSEFRKNFHIDFYKKEVKPINKDFIYLDNYYEIDNGVNCYFLTINDIAIGESWFTFWSHSITLGDYEIEINHIVDPIIEINNDVYFLLDAYEQGLIDDELTSKIYDCFKYNSQIEPIPIEHKLQEREYTVHNLTNMMF